MKNTGIRSVLFWIHLAAGVVAGTIILIMSVTGALLTFQQSVLAFLERSQRVVEPPSPGAARLDVDTLLERVRAAVDGARPTTLTFDSDPRAAAIVALGTQGTVFVNPYTGAVLGTGSTRARIFYRTVTNWHRWLAVEGEHRTTARAITGACNAAFLVLGATGLVLWWPRQLTLRKVGSVIWFRRGLQGRARDFNWHNAIGFWCAPVIIVLTTTGTVISYTWASNLVYTLTGSSLPAASAGRGGAAAPSGEAAGRGRGGRGAAPSGRGAANDRTRDPQPGQGVRAAETTPAESIGLSAMMAQAERHVPTWRTTIIRLPAQPGGPVTLSISDRNYWNSFARSTLTIDASSGAEISWQPYSQSSRGQKVRGWMRFAHTGELGGWLGETVAGVASAGGTFLVWTGIALALRRLVAWRSRRRQRSTAVPPEGAAAA